MLRPTSEIFAIPPWAPEVAVPSDQWNGGYSLSRLVHSRWLAPPFGMGYHWHCDCFPGFTLMHSTLALKQLFLAVLESGALLSSNHEEALYKST